jgi:hypothetical protein
MAPEEWDPYTGIDVPDAGDYRARSSGDNYLDAHRGPQGGLTSRRVSSG